MSVPLLTGSVSLVSGASSGIGKGIAIQLGKAGSKVYITGRNKERINEVKLKCARNMKKKSKNISTCLF